MFRSQHLNLHLWRPSPNLSPRDRSRCRLSRDWMYRRWPITRRISREIWSQARRLHLSSSTSWCRFTALGRIPPFRSRPSCFWVIAGPENYLLVQGANHMANQETVNLEYSALHVLYVALSMARSYSSSKIPHHAKEQLHHKSATTTTMKYLHSDSKARSSVVEQIW
jgi:hypothetical protein